MQLKPTLLSLVVAAAFSLCPAHAQEWTRFRGPNGTGVVSAPGIPVQISEADFVWRVELPGEGMSSPVIWGGRLFVTSAEPEKGKRHLICLDSASGRTLWTRAFEFPKHGKHQFNSFASSTAAVDAEAVYSVWTTPQNAVVVAHDHNGKELWKRDLGAFNCNHAGGGSPIVVGNVVIVAKDTEQRLAPEGVKPESFLIALDRRTGAVRWKKERTTSEQATSFATPLVLRPEGGAPEVVFSSQAHGLTSVNPETGAVNWELSDLFKMRPVGSPILANGLILQTSGQGDGSRRAVAVRPGNKARSVEPKFIYEVTRDSAYVPTPIAYNGRVYFYGDGGIITSTKAESGEVVWKERAPGTNAKFFGSPVCVNGKLYAMTASGAASELVVIDTADEFRVLGRTPLGEASHSTPSVANGMMFLRTMSKLIAVGRKAQ